jgi:hypothetical protein
VPLRFKGVDGSMLSFRRRVIPTTLLMLAAGVAVLACQPPSGGPTAKGRKVIPTPHLRVGGRVNRITRPAPGVVHLDASVPGARSSVTYFLIKVGKPSLLLRAGDDGRMTPIGLDDLYKGGELDGVRAVVSRETDPVDKTHLVYWLVVYPKGVMAPNLWDKEPDTTYDY